MREKMPNQEKLSNNLIGSAGEYFVAGELSRHGIVAALTMAGTNEFDILAIDPESKKKFSIQVKTTKKHHKIWALNKKDEKVHGENSFYVFVWLPDNAEEKPDYYIIPAEIVARTIKEEHGAWLQAKGKKGQPHQDTSIRVFRIGEQYEKYHNAWGCFKQE